MSFDVKTTQDALLYILMELAKEVDGHLNEITLRRRLEGYYGINRTREWVQTQMHKLAGLEAITITGGGEIMIAHLERSGRDHLASRAIVAGVTRPADID